MNTIFRALALVLLASAALAAPNPSPGLPGMPSSSTVRFLGNKGFGAPIQLGEQITFKTIQQAKGTYRFAKQGGASVVLPSTVLANLADVDGKDLVLPANAVIRSIFVDTVANVSGSPVNGFTTPFIGLGLSTPGDLLAYTNTSTFKTTAFVAGLPNSSVLSTYKKVKPSMVRYGQSLVKMGPGDVIQLNMKGGSLISGDLNFFIEYYLSD